MATVWAFAAHFLGLLFQIGVNPAPLAGEGGAARRAGPGEGAAASQLTSSARSFPGARWRRKGRDPENHRSKDWHPT